MKQNFSTRDAAIYLNIAYDTMKYHIFRVKTIKGQKIGNSLMFTREQLNEFKANRRSPGRPRKTEEND